MSIRDRLGATEGSNIRDLLQDVNLAAKGSLAATAFVIANGAPQYMKDMAEARKGEMGDYIQICDGVADNIEIQAAIDALTSGRTWIETVKCIGSFSIAATLEPDSLTRLDFTEAKLTLATGTNDHFLVNSDTSGGNTDIEIVGGVFDFNGSNQSAGCHGIRPQKVTRFRVLGSYLYNSQAHLITVAGNGVDDTVINYDILIQGVTCDTTSLNGSGILVACADNVVMDGNIVRDVSLDGLQVKSCNHAVFSNNVVDTVGRAGLQDSYSIALDSTDVVYTGNTIYNTTTQGIISYAEGVVINGNRINTAGTQGIRVEDAYGATVVGNTVKDATGSGVLLEDQCFYCVIEANTVEGSGADGIFVNGGTRNTVNANTVRNSATNFSGIRLYNTSYNILEGNHCVDDQGSATQKYGIREDGTSDYNIITGNELAGNVTAATYLLGRNSVVRNNKGHTASGDVVTISKTIDHASLTDGGGTTGYMDFDDTIPAGSIIKAVKCDFTEAWTSDNTTTLTMMVGYVADLDAFNLTADPGENAFNHTTDVYWGESSCQVPTVSAAKTPRVTFTEDSDATQIISGAGAQGAVTITITFMKA